MGVTNGAGLFAAVAPGYVLCRGLSYEADDFRGGSEFHPGAMGCCGRPYLFGERTPHLDAEARAAFVGDYSFDDARAFRAGR